MFKALQPLNVLCVERHVHDHQPANNRQGNQVINCLNCVCLCVCVLPVLRPSVINNTQSSKLPLKVHLKAAVDPQEQHLSEKADFAEL